MRATLARLDQVLAQLGSFPNPLKAREAVALSRDLMALIVQELEELRARIDLHQEEHHDGSA